MSENTGRHDVETESETARSTDPGAGGDVETATSTTDEPGRSGPDTETGGAPRGEPAGATSARTRAQTPSGSEDDEETREEDEDHLDPEPLAMSGEDVLHALDPEHWLPENRGEDTGGEDREDREDSREERKYPYIRSDFPAPFG